MHEQVACDIWRRQMHAIDRRGMAGTQAAGADRPELGEHSMLKVIAAVSPCELPSFVAALDEAIARWRAESASTPSSDLDAELARLHALKSITSALGSRLIASACDHLGECLRSGAAADHIRRRSQALAVAAQRLLQRSIVSHR